MQHLLPYLLLVTFFTPTIGELKPSHLQALDNSPYQGVAVPLRDAYSVVPVSEAELYQTHGPLLQKCNKHVWPWIFLNRIVGFKRGDKAMAPAEKPEIASRFDRIQGMDLYNQQGALADFYATWRAALGFARRLGSPGIVIDLECYNRYRVWSIGWLSRFTGKPEWDLEGRLHEIGKDLADAAIDVYPDATLWFLSTDLTKVFKMKSGRVYRPTSSLLVLGILARAKERNARLKVVSGGLESLGYCQESLTALKNKISKRNSDLAPLLESYKNLYLAGTISPWDKPESKQAWLLKGECAKSSIQSIDEFIPFLGTLSGSYRFLWIYAAGAASYNPYDQTVSSTYNSMIKRALTRWH